MNNMSLSEMITYSTVLIRCSIQMEHREVVQDLL